MYFMFFYFDDEITKENKQRFIDRLIKEVPNSKTWAEEKIMRIDDIQYINLIIDYYESKGYKWLEEYVEFLNNHRLFNAQDFLDKYCRSRGLKKD